MTKKDLKDITYQLNGAAIDVHKELGPGLLESVYHKCMEYELWLRGIDFKSELVVPVNYKAMELNTQLRCDLFIEDSIVVELKTVETLLPVHDAQVMSYMKLLDAPKGIIYNFKTQNLYKHGQKTFVNRIFEGLDEG